MQTETPAPITEAPTPTPTPVAAIKPVIMGEPTPSPTAAPWPATSMEAYNILIKTFGPEQGSYSRYPDNYAGCYVRSMNAILVIQLTDLSEDTLTFYHDLFGGESIYIEYKEVEYSMKELARIRDEFIQSLGLSRVGGGFSVTENKIDIRLCTCYEDHAAMYDELMERDDWRDLPIIIELNPPSVPV